MKNNQILGRALLKASKRNNKFSPFAYNIKEVVCGYVSFENIIFSHDFAKAFWGEEDFRYCGDCLIAINEIGQGIHDEDCPDERMISQPAWIFHRQQMIIELEPLKYLEKFL